jgi:hypothetical protein
MEATCSSKRSINFNGLHGVISQKIGLFITTAVITSNPINYIWCFSHKSPVELLRKHRLGKETIAPSTHKSISTTAESGHRQCRLITNLLLLLLLLLYYYYYYYYSYSR